MTRWAVPALALGVAVCLAACSSPPGSPSAAPSTSSSSTTVPGPPKPTATTVELVLLTSLQDLNEDNAHLSSELGTMKVANDGGASISSSAVSGYVNPVVQLLTTVGTGLKNALPMLPANVVAAAQALSASVTSALQAFESTDSLDLTGTSGSGVSSGVSGLINSALGGPLIPDYQDNAAQVTKMEQTTERQFVSELEAAVSTK